MCGGIPTIGAPLISPATTAWALLWPDLEWLFLLLLMDLAGLIRGLLLAGPPPPPESKGDKWSKEGGGGGGAAGAFLARARFTESLMTSGLGKNCGNLILGHFFFFLSCNTKYLTTSTAANSKQPKKQTAAAAAAAKK